MAAVAYMPAWRHIGPATSTTSTLPLGASNLAGVVGTLLSPSKSESDASKDEPLELSRRPSAFVVVLISPTEVSMRELWAHSVSRVRVVQRVLGGRDTLLVTPTLSA